MLKIMLVDNEAAIRKGLAHGIHWETLGCTVAAQAVDGVDALAQIPQVQPDIVISDIRMPGMDGLALAEELHRFWPGIKTIILTGFPNFSYAQKAIACQVVDLVLKPTSVEQLTAAVERAKALIQQERSRQELQSELANRSEENLSLQRHMFLRDLIRRGRLSTLYVLSRMSQLQLNLNSYYVLSVVVAPQEKASEANCLPFLHDAQTVLRDCIQGHEVHFVSLGDRTCFAVVPAPELQNLEEWCQETISIVESILRYQLSIGISRRCTDPLRMAEAAEEARQAQQFADYAQPEQPVMRYANLPAVTQESMKEVIRFLRLLKSAVEHQNSDAAQKSLQALFEYIRLKKLPLDEVRNICASIYNFCSAQMFLSGSEDDLGGGRLSTMKNLMESGSIQSLEETLRLVVGKLQQRHGDMERPDALAKNVQDYICQHYTEDLSLEALASIVHLSPSYLSKLFKKEVGENISTYVQNIRIGQAKLLLHTTGLKTYEVAEQVGIPDPVYFSRIFKKVTGVKPKDFRHQPLD